MEPVNENQNRLRHSNKTIFGIVVIAAGLLLLGSNFNIISYKLHHLIFSWPMILIGIGTVSLIASENNRPGLILIAIGGYFLIPKLLYALGLDFIDTNKMFFPMLLIAIGVIIIMKKGFLGSVHLPKSNVGNFTSFVEEGYINESNIFSGSKHKVVNQVFKGGKVSNIFGGTEIDLTQAALAEGRNELVIECIFGGVTLIVPSDWKVVLNISSIMGGFSDKRLHIRESADSNRILVVKGSAIFGGGELKSY